MANLNGVDLVILSIFGISILLGFIRGFISEVVSLATLVAAFVVAIMFSNSLATVFTHTAMVQNAVTQTSNAIGANTAQPVSYLALGLSFGVLFAVTIIAGTIIKALLNIAFHTGVLGIGNRLLGAIFGLARGFLINLVLIFIVQLTSFGDSPLWKQSQWAAIFQPAVIWLDGIVSPALADLKTKITEGVQGVGTQIQNMER